MRLIDKLVFKDLVGPFINGLMMFILLLFAAAYLFPATELLVKGVPITTVGQLVLFSLPSVITQTFPMAMLLSALLAFGRLSGDHEAVAIFAAGVSFPRAIRSVWIMGAVVSVVAFVWNDTIVPPASTAYHDLKQAATRNLLKSERPMAYTLEDPETKGMDRFVTIDGGFDARSKTLRRVSIVVYSRDPKTRGQQVAYVYCNRAQPVDDRGLKWKYYDGYHTVFTPDPETGQFSDFVTVRFKELETLPRGAAIGKNFEAVLSSEITDPNRKSFGQLQAEITAKRAKGEDVRGMEVDLYGKIALPLASLIFGVVGAALGVNKQRGGSKAVGFGLAIFIVFLYWVFYHSMFVAGKSGGLPPMLASFLADIVGAVVGVILMIRASR